MKEWIIALDKKVPNNCTNVRYKNKTLNDRSYKDVPEEFTKVKKAVLVKKLKKANDENDDLKNQNEGLRIENSNLKKELKDLNKKNDDLQKLMDDNKKLTEKVINNSDQNSNSHSPFM